MSKIIESTYNFIKYLDSSDTILNLIKYKELSLNNDKVQELIKLYNESSINEDKIKYKKKLYNINEYKEYIGYYNELSYIIIKINTKFKEYANTKNKD